MKQRDRAPVRRARSWVVGLAVALLLCGMGGGCGAGGATAGGATEGGATAGSGRALHVGAGAAYATVQAALDAARDGDTVVVGAGRFEGRVVIEGAVSVRGAGPGATVLVWGGEGAVVEAVGASGSLTNVEVRHEGRDAGEPRLPDAGSNDAVRLHDGRFGLTDVFISASPDDGVVLSGSHAGVLSGVVVSGVTGAGLLVLDRVKAEVTRLTVSGAQMGAQIGGAAALSASDWTVSEAQVFGVAIAESARGVFRAVTVLRGASNGVLVAGHAAPVFEGLRSEGNREEGVVVGDRGQPLFRDCMVSDNQGFGVYAGGGSRALFERCRVMRNAVGGFSLGGESDTRVVGSWVEVNGPARKEVAAGQGAGAKRDGAKGEGVQGEGVQGEGAQGVSLYGVGFSVMDAATPEVDATVIAGNARVGLMLAGQSAGNYRSLTVRENGDGGFYVADRAAPRVVATRVEANRGDGLLATGPVRVEWVGGTLSANTGCGVRVAAESKVNESGASVSENVQGDRCVLAPPGRLGVERHDGSGGKREQDK